MDSPYPVMSPVQRKRFQARHLQTTYCYDFLDLLRQTISLAWQKHRSSGGPAMAFPSEVLQARELILASLGENKYEIQETDRPIGWNDIGMVAWKATFFTPEFPEGRNVIIIANGIQYTNSSPLSY
jgi:acetyl-CoA carboxylase/biotin carboxylase 1